MIACYLVKDQGLSAGEAIKYVRKLRPYSIETREQEDLVYEYSEYHSHSESENLPNAV